MEIPTIYGHLLSQPTRSVILYCELSGIQYQFQEVNLLAGEHLKRPFRKLNPNQEVPVLVLNSFNLWESAAIIQYLSEKYDKDSQYFPKDPEVKSRILAYLHWHHENIRRPIVNYTKKKIMFPILMGKPEPTEAQEKKLRQKAVNVCHTLEWVLQDTGYVGRTANATIADIFAFNEILNGYFSGVTIVGFTRLSEWFYKIASIPEVKKICGTHIDDFLKSISPKI